MSSPTSMFLIWFLFAVAAVFAAPAHGIWWVQDEIGMGNQGFRSNVFVSHFKVSRRVGFGLSHGIYSDDMLKKAVNSASLVLNLTSRRRLLGLRASYYPRVLDSESAGGTVFMVLPLEGGDPDTAGQAGLSLSAYHHKSPFAFADGSASRKEITEFAAQGDVKQLYFDMFQFTFSASGYLYDRGFTGVENVGCLFNQDEVGLFGTTRSVTHFPRYALGIQFIRRGEPGLQTHFFCSFTRIRLVKDLGFIWTGTAGMDFKISDSWRFDFNWNPYRHQGDTWRSYYAVVLNYAYK